MDQDLKIIFDALERRFEGRQLLGPKELSEIFGLSKGTVYNQISSGRFPISVSKKSSHPKCRLIDVAKFLAES